MLQRFGEIRARVRLGLFQPGEQAVELSLARRRPDVAAHFVVENDQPGGIALARGWPDKTSEAAVKRA